MMIPIQVFRKFGLLNENYFLYCEEIDYCERVKKVFHLGYASQSIVFHKEGVTTGASSRFRKKSKTAEFHAVRSRLLFTKAFYPACLPTVYFMVLLRIVLHVVKFDWSRAWMLCKLSLVRM